MRATLIFDYDGVIVDSLDIFMSTFVAACRSEGFCDVATKEDFLNLYEDNMFESMHHLGMSKEQILRIVFSMRDGLMLRQHEVHVFPGMDVVLKQLADMYPMVIVTSNDSTVVKRYLDGHGLSVFDDVIGSDKEASKLKKILEIKSRFDDAKCLYIGDTKGDIVEGKRADVKTIAVSWGWHDESRLKKANPDYIVHTPDELLYLLQHC